VLALIGLPMWTRWVWERGLLLPIVSFANLLLIASPSTLAFILATRKDD
jgi:hypothetical protein